MSKRKHTGLDLSSKLKLLKESDAGKSISELCQIFGISDSTVRRILKKRELVEAECVEGHGKLKRMRPSEFPELEKCLTEWIKQCT